MMKVVHHRLNNSTTKPPKKSLLFDSQNIAGLSAQSRKEAINLMDLHDIKVTCIQETWTGTIT